MTWRDKNFGKSQFDPDYDDVYDAEADYYAYCTAREEREELKREE